jgi:hypothetical protein
VGRTYKQVAKDLTELLGVAQKEVKRLQAVSLMQSKALADAMYEKNQALAAHSAMRTRVEQETARANEAVERNIAVLGLNTPLNNRLTDLKAELEQLKKSYSSRALPQPKFKAGDIVKVTEGSRAYGYFEVEGSRRVDNVIVYDFVNPSGYTGFSYNGTAECYCKLVAAAESTLEDEGDE